MPKERFLESSIAEQPHIVSLGQMYASGIRDRQTQRDQK